MGKREWKTSRISQVYMGIRELFDFNSNKRYSGDVPNFWV